MLIHDVTFFKGGPEPYIKWASRPYCATQISQFYLAYPLCSWTRLTCRAFWIVRTLPAALDATRLLSAAFWDPSPTHHINERPQLVLKSAPVRTQQIVVSRVAPHITSPPLSAGCTQDSAE